MPDRTIRTETEADDLLRGLVMLGTGGGGHPKIGRKMLLRHLQAGREIGWKDLNNVSDDAWVCCVFGMGSVAPHDPLSEQERRQLGYVGKPTAHPMVEAVRELEAYSGTKIQALVSFEPGAVASSSPLDVAAEMGLDVLDADNCGRAVPKLSQTLVSLAGHTLWPAAICDTWGNQLILKSAPSAELAEQLGKMVSIVSKRPDAFALCAHAGFLTQLREVRHLLVHNTLTKALTIGTEIREAREIGADPVDAARRALEGWLLFTGTITRREWESRDGYMFGTTFIEGDGDYSDHTLEIWLQNENHISWLDGKPYVTSPDLIMIVDQNSAEPYVNTVLEEGQKVAVLGSKLPAYRNEIGLNAMGPRHFGFDIPYRPVEELVG